MPFVYTDRTVMAELRFTLDNQRIENTLWFQKDSDWTSSEASSFALALSTWWDANIAPELCQELALQEVYVTDQAFQNSFAVSYNVGGSVTGDIIGAALPNSVALAVSFRTDFRGRSYRGRNYVAGFAEQQVTNNTVGSTYVSGLVTGYGSLVNFATSEGCTWVVVSRYSQGQPRGSGLATPVTGVLITDTTVDSQRRRLPGRGY